MAGSHVNENALLRMVSTVGIVNMVSIVSGKKVLLILQIRFKLL